MALSLKQGACESLQFLLYFQVYDRILFARRKFTLHAADMLIQCVWQTFCLNLANFPPLLVHKSNRSDERTICRDFFSYIYTYYAHSALHEIYLALQIYFLQNLHNLQHSLINLVNSAINLHIFSFVHFLLRLCERKNNSVFPKHSVAVYFSICTSCCFHFENLKLLGHFSGLSVGIAFSKLNEV